MSFALPIGNRSTPLLAIALLVAACSEGPTTPDLTPQLGRERSGRRWTGTPNHQRYRDRGGHPRSGRSGSATATAQLLVNAAGRATLVVTSYRATDLQTPAGLLAKVQLKCFAGRERVFIDLDFHDLSVNPFTAVVRGVAPGTACVVQAHVRGIDGRRTDVVTVTLRAQRSPDLAVTDLIAPVSVVVGAPTVVSATVAELNGDVGAQADCVLDVDGVEADRASGIWVDAGDLVSCAFTATFGAVGTRELRVRVVDVTPADFDPTNNAAMGSVQVLAVSAVVGAPGVSYGADVNDLTFTVADSFSTRWTFVPSGQLLLEVRSDHDSSGRMQTALFSATIAVPVSFPLARIELSQASGGRLLHTARWDGLAADPGGSSGASCVVRGIGTGVEFYLCSEASGFTAITYLRQAGTVTYSSTGYDKTWNGASYDENTYVTNGTGTVGTVSPLGPTYTFDVRVTDGATVYDVGAVVPLGPVSISDVTPRQCSTVQFTIAPDTFDVLTCVASAFIATGVGGSVTGMGVVGLAAATP